MFGMSDSSEFAFLVVLLPLLPAILIFVIFPKARMLAQGPLQGLSIRAGGAFGAYLIIMLVLMAWMSTMGLRTIPRTWTVEAYVIVKDKNGHIIRPNAVNRDAFSIAYSPTYIRAVPRRDYVKITATATEVEQNIPAMTITYGREGNVIFDLDDPSIQAVRHNWKNKYVITTPLAMQPIVDQDAFGNVTAGP